ncbi:MAG: hypothetical protein ACLQGV_16470 [Bryobacteraceae bacterium]
MRMLKLMSLWMLTLAVSMAADHPIIISGGSPLRLQHDSWNAQDDQTLATALHANTVTRVEVKSDGGAAAPIVFHGERLDLRLTYGSIQLTVTTDRNGHDPVVKVDKKTSLKKHFRRTDDATFESVRSDGSIQGVTILKAGANQPLGAVSGHTEIVIHYE